LKDLESLSDTSERFLTSNALEKLALPKLQYLKMGIAEERKRKRLHDGKYVMRKKKISIEQATLNKLAVNCPKLLRLFGINNESPNFIFCQRLNATTTFRKVLRIQETDDGDNWRFDDDSVGSCSSDDNSEGSYSSDEDSVESCLSDDDDHMGSYCSSDDIW
jgi:hypothetical protein